ncbi:MAG: zinc ribbon domain-containing protein [Clostridia bacterium]|nr:zinc ribbon domain-containing protein [Clostridia bacterium]
MKYCPNCEKPLEDEALFCDTCGTAAAESDVSVEPAVSAESAVAEEIPAVEVAPIEEEVPSEPATSSVVSSEAVSAVVASARDLINKVPKTVLMIAGAALAVIILLTVILSLFTGGTPDHALYIKDGELIYSTLKKGGDIITDEPTTYAMHMLSADGEKLFFVEDGDLYWCPPTKPEKAEKIAGNVSSFLINEDGNRVTYQKDGDLYQSDLKEADRIASDVEGFIVTKDGKMVMYGKDDAIYVQRVGKDEKEKLGSDDSLELHYMSEDLKEFYFSDEDKLYFKKFGKDREEIARDVSTVIQAYEDGDIYYVTVDEDSGERTLYYYNGNKSVAIAENYSGYEAVAAEKPVLLFSVYEDDGRVRMLASKDKTGEIDLEEISSAQFTADGKKLYYFSESDEGGSTLCEAKVSGTKLKDAEEYDDEVAYFALYGDHVVTRKDVEDSLCTLWIDGEEVDTDVASLRYDENSDKFYFMTEDDTLKMYKNKVKTIHDEVGSYTILPNGQVLFLYDISESSEEGDLYLFKGTGKAKKLDDSVSYIVPVYDIDTLYENIFGRY